MKSTIIARHRPSYSYELSAITKHVCIAGLVLSWIIGGGVIAGAIYVLKIGEAATQTHLSALARELIPLGLNLIVTILSDCMGFVHGQALKLSLVREGRLNFNANLRLFSSSRRSKPNKWYSNAVSALCLVISFSSTSVTLLGRGTTQFGSEPVRISGIALLALGTGILGQAIFATWALNVVAIPTWSSSPLDTAMAIQEAGIMQRVTGRCMLSVHDINLPSVPTRPKERQRSALAAHREVRYILVYIWGLIPLSIVWAVVVYVLIIKGFNGGLRGNNWSFFPTINGFLGGSDHEYDASATPTLNFGWGPPSSTYGDPYNDRPFDLFWTLAFMSGLQIPLTMALHCAELEIILSRDESVWRKATSSSGCDPKYGSIRAAATSWQSIGLFLFKPVLHWMFGLSITVYSGAGVNMRPPQIFYLATCSTIFALFITYVSTRRLNGPQPAAYGHIQTLINLIDHPCRELHWGHKETGDICHAGTSSHRLQPIRMDKLYS